MKSRILFSVLALLFVFAALLPAQSITGTITGVVQDPSGARVANATVVAANEETGVNYKTATTEAGLYVIPQLPLGRYAVSVTSTGFKMFVRSDLTLTADEHLRVDVALEVGHITEKVEIGGVAPLIETERAVLSGSFTSDRFDRLPIGRDPLATFQLVPGSQPVTGGFATAIFNGGHEETTDYKVDGAAATFSNTYRAPTAPIQEMVEEVVVQTSNYSAEFGRGTAQLSINTRAGTNEFHGVLFEYFGNDAIDANSFFGNLQGNTRPQIRNNIFGGTVGGPLILPKIYNGHDRTFFTFGYQGQRQVQYQQTVSTVPTAALRAGNFAGQPTVFDPASNAPGPNNTVTRQPFANNVIPTNRFDPVAMAMLANSYPLPNRPGAVNNYVQASPGPVTNTNMNARLDHNFSDKNRFTARYTRWYQIAHNPLRWPGPSGVATPNSVEWNNAQDTILSMEDSHNIRSNIINTFRMGYFFYHQQLFGPGTDQNWAAQLGLKNAGPEKFPSASISGLTGFGGANLSRTFPARNIQVADSILLVKDRHAIKFGFEYRRYRDQEYGPQNSSGNFLFNTQPTMNLATRAQGVGFASFLLGYPSNSQLSIYPANGIDTSWPFYSAFLQDDFRVSKRLTLNLGVRWELNMPYHEAANQLSNYNLGTRQIDLAGRNGFPTTLYDPNYKGIGPRVGLAFTPFDDNKTVLRAAYGMFYLPSNAVGGEPFTAGPWFRTITFPSPDNGITFPITLAKGFPLVGVNSPYGPDPTLSVTYTPSHIDLGYMQQWNMNIQRQLGRRALIEVGYVGNKGNHLSSRVGLNQVPENLLGVGTPQNERPYPNIGSIVMGPGSEPVGNSQYHALNVRAERRFANGFSGQMAYTFGKSIDDFLGNGSFSSNAIFATTSVQNNYNLRAEKSLSNFNTAQSLSWSFVYDIPVGKGRRFLNHGGVINAVLGGWSFSTLSVAHSGLPLVMGTVQNNTGSIDGGSRPNRIGNPVLPSDQRGIYGWFNAAAFALPPSFKFGNDSRTEGQLWAPGTVNVNALLDKRFLLGEHRDLEFRCEAVNALNHFNPGTPNTTIGGPGVGLITTGNNGRELLLALKLHY
jgi:hypothetical protein